ncbi:MAG: peptide ABC transporter substrate-binding protein [Acidobacteria bacterium]|nr:peptide ABC transporter substrate-binding protein [Acidobacteriota bacterium]
MKRHTPYAAKRPTSSYGLLWRASLCLVALLLGVCFESLVSTQARAAGRSEGGTLRLLYWQAPTIVNPHLSTGTKDLSASRIVYEPLASFDAKGELVPFLAAEIPSLENGGVAADGRSVTWRLKQGVKWADGTPFTANDVLFTYRYIINPDVGAASVASYDQVKSVQVIDDHTVKVEFHDVNPAWAQPFVGVKGMIIPEHIFAPFNGSNAADAPANVIAIGTGPYRVAKFNEEDILIIGDDIVSTIKIVYEPNRHFREPGKPAFGKVELQGGGDAIIAAAAMAKGLADFAWNLQVDDATLGKMESSGQATAVVEPNGAFVERIMLNFADPGHETESGERASPDHPHPILSDLKVRRAIAHGIDRQAILKLYGRGGQPTDALLVSPTRYRSSKATIGFDPEAAKALLEAAGWRDSDGDGLRDKDGRKLTLLFQTSINPVRQQTQEIVKQNLLDIGIDVQLKSIDSSIFFGPVAESTNSRRHFYADLQEFAYSNRSPDPGAYMKAWTCGEVARMANNWATGNWARYCNPAYDELYLRSTKEMDPEKRRALFLRMNDILIEDAAVIPLVHLVDWNGISTTVAGVEMTAWDVEVWNIKDWRRE